MTTFISTLGFDTSHLQNLLVEEDVKDGDRLLIVRPEDDDSRGESAVQDVEGMVGMLDTELTTEVVRFEPGEYEATVTELVDRLNDTDGDIVVSLSGGDRFLLVSLAVAAMSTTADVRTTHLRSDVTRESYEVEVPSVRPSLNDRDAEVLSYVVDNGSVSNTRIAAATGNSETTVHRSVEALDDMGYVEVDEDGGSNSVEATLMGKVAGKTV
ncbi:CRISPR-associated CARF protein Csa3 [Haladaptatus sp. F3-133]|uniref:CRISPR-associated CARF protein Csa3 n=1 Tax=Halorutilus salinus TaxID=2487751 RepID=A0A9Q4C5D9_9EURY|nr:CRISPR-associated CARF protein Csa3 [Halorutilus salinus]MCX2819377.1 CRISPR-associated CARF protein Csa3 [Halorutilus salinus]